MSTIAHSSSLRAKRRTSRTIGPNRMEPTRLEGTRMEQSASSGVSEDVDERHAGLNAEQLAVVLHMLGPLLVAAVAGCGKTRAIVHRIVELVRRGVDQARILAVTFSAKAAKEMNV